MKIKLFLWNFVKKTKTELLSYYSLVIIANFLGIVFAGYILQLIMDKVKNNDFKNIILYIIIFSIFYSCRLLFDIFMKGFEYTARKKIDKNYVLDLFSKALDYEISYFSNNLTGQLTSKIFNIQTKLLRLYLDFVDVISCLILFFSGMIIFYFINPLILYFGVVWLIIYISISFFFLKYISNISNKISENNTKSLGVINDCFTNISNIKIFSTEKKEYKTVKKQSLNILKNKKEKLNIENILYFFNYISFSVFAIFVIFLTFTEYMDKNITVGTLLFVYTYSLVIFYWISNTMYEFIDIISNISTINNSINTLLVEPKIADKKNAKKLIANNGKVTFKNITFSYGVDK